MVKAVLLAGGKGVRLRPLTYEMAKSIIPVQGRTLLDNVIDLYFKHNVFEIWLMLGYRAQDVIDKYPYPYYIEKHPLGTGGWLHRVDKKYFNGHFFVCNADNLFNLDLREMMRQHLDNNHIVTIACTHVKDVRGSGSVHIKDNKIMSFEEKIKSKIKKPGYINGGYYIFSEKIFDYIPKLKDGDKGILSLEYDVFPKIVKDGKLGAYVSDAQWFSTNTMAEYKKVVERWKGISL